MHSIPTQMKTLFGLMLLLLTSFQVLAQTDTESNENQSYMEILFQKFILNELGALSKDEYQKIDKLNLHTVYNRNKEEWPNTIVAALKLSNTIDITIWDLWIKNIEKAKKQNIAYSKEQFASEFVINYYAEDSQVDVWKAKDLKEAKTRIKAYRASMD